MTEVSLRKLNTHYVMPHADRAEWRKLERLQMKVLDDAFELAIERAGIPKDGELCLRSVSAPVRLRLDSSDQSITAHWTAELAQSLTDVIRNGPRSRRVFYYSRQQAVFDFALCVTRGEYERAWAWQQLGLWVDRNTVESANAVRELVQALTREPELIVPVFRYLAPADALPAMSRRLSSSQWQELSEAALMHAGVFLVRDDSDGTPSSRVFSYALRILECSQILAAISYSAVLQGAGETMRRSIAALAILEAEAALLYSPVAASVVDVVASSIAANRQTVTVSQAAESKHEISPQPPLEEASEYNNEVSDPRRRARTDYGGLLFLIHVIDQLELPQQIVGDSVLGVRPLSWVLHQLAMSLTPVGPTDAAALAFAGLLPDASPPSELEPLATHDETQAVTTLAARIVEHLSSLAIAEDTELQDFVCHRHAEIVADPAWIEVRFSLDQVATEIRRAGLDLDPGYVKWLGVVLKFVYE